MLLSVRRNLHDFTTREVRARGALAGAPAYDDDGDLAFKGVIT
jgi:hypothetical protein